MPLLKKHLVATHKQTNLANLTFLESNFCPSCCINQSWFRFMQNQYHYFLLFSPCYKFFRPIFIELLPTIINQNKTPWNKYNFFTSIHRVAKDAYMTSYRTPVPKRICLLHSPNSLLWILMFLVYFCNVDFRVFGIYFCEVRHADV